MQGWARAVAAAAETPSWLRTWGCWGLAWALLPTVLLVCACFLHSQKQEVILPP